MLSSADATHLLGGDISYHYVDTVQNGYLIRVRLFRDPDGISVPTMSLTLQEESSCFANRNHTVPFVGLETRPLSGIACVDTNLTNFKSIEIYTYERVVVLPGLCSDFTFSYSTCCRPNNLDNLLSSSSQDFFISATFNNIYPNLVSPVWYDDGAIALCVGLENNWPLSYDYTHQDSLRFVLTAPRTNATTNSVYAGSYTASQPMTSMQGTQFHLDEATGDITVTPGAMEYVAVVLTAETYRFDSLFFTWVKTGSSPKEMAYIVKSQCDTTKLFPTFDQSTIDSVACNSKKITLRLPGFVRSNSISPNLGEFALYGPDNQRIPITGIRFLDAFQPRRAQNIELEVLDSLYLNGAYHIQLRAGSNQNTLISICGKEYPILDSVSFEISDVNCGNIAVRENLMRDEISIYPNPARDYVLVSIPAQANGVLVEIYTSDGRLATSFIAQSGENTFSTSGLTQGVYFVRITENDLPVKTEKLLITN